MALDRKAQESIKAQDGRVFDCKTLGDGHETVDRGKD